MQATGGPAPRRLAIATLPVTLPTAIVRAAAFPAPGSIVVAGGETATGTRADIVRVPLAAGGVVRLGTLASPVHDAASAVVGDRFLLFGGGRTIAERVVQSAGTLDGRGQPALVGELPRPRADAVAVSVGESVYIVGGWTGAAPDAAVLATIDGVSFRTVAALRLGVRYPAVATLGGLIYAVGGDSAAGPTDAIQIVDPTSGASRLAARLPYPLAGATALVVGGHLLVAGGRRDGAPTADVLEIDPTTLRVVTVGRLAGPRAEAAGVVVDGVGYLVGGEAASPLASIVSLAFR